MERVISKHSATSTWRKDQQVLSTRAPAGFPTDQVEQGREKGKIDFRFCEIFPWTIDEQNSCRIGRLSILTEHISAF